MYKNWQSEKESMNPNQNLKLLTVGLIGYIRIIPTIPDELRLLNLKPDYSDSEAQTRRTVTCTFLQMKFMIDTSWLKMGQALRKAHSTLATRGPK